MTKDDPKPGDEIACADDAGPGDDPQDHAGEPDTFELELNGQVHTLPAALKGAFLRQADYTRKTQELAQHRRALEAERAQVAQQAQAATGAMSDRAHLAAMDQHLASLSQIDWRALAQHDPQQAEALWARFHQTRNLRHHYAQAVAQHETHGRIAAERQAAEAMAETGRVLARELPGWSPELAAKLSDYAVSQGVTLEELKAASDPRIWKVLHKAFQAEHGASGEKTGKAAAVRPAVTVTGGAASTGGVRDELGTKEWMARRNDHLRKGR